MLALLFGVVKERYLDKTGIFLLSRMAFFFITPAVGLLGYTHLVSSIWLEQGEIEGWMSSISISFSALWTALILAFVF